MAFFDRMSRLVKATVNDQITKRQDPEQQLEQIYQIHLQFSYNLF